MRAFRGYGLHLRFFEANRTVLGSDVERAITISSGKDELYDGGAAMKEVMIILRPKMCFPTKDALDQAGFHSMTIREIIGRGKCPVSYTHLDVYKRQRWSRESMKNIWILIMKKTT